MPHREETSLDQLRELIAENERSLEQAKRLLQWLEAYVANESIRRMFKLSEDESQYEPQAIGSVEAFRGDEASHATVHRGFL